MTYTTVSKVYTGRDLAEAAAAMLKDPDVWRQGGGVLADLLGGQGDAGVYTGDQAGYALDHWEMRGTEEGVELTCHFR